MLRKPRRWLLALSLSPLAFPLASGILPGSPAVSTAVALGIVALASLLAIGRDVQLLQRAGGDMDERGLRLLLPPLYLSLRERGGTRVLTAVWWLCLAAVVAPGWAVDRASRHGGLLRCDDARISGYLLKSVQGMAPAGTRITDLVWVSDVSSFWSDERDCAGVMADDAGGGTPIEFTLTRDKLRTNYLAGMRNALGRYAPSAPLGCDTPRVLFSAARHFSQVARVKGIEATGFNVVGGQGSGLGLSCDYRATVASGEDVTGRFTWHGLGPFHAVTMDNSPTTAP